MSQLTTLLRNGADGFNAAPPAWDDEKAIAQEVLPKLSEQGVQHDGCGSSYNSGVSAWTVGGGGYVKKEKTPTRISLLNLRSFTAKISTF